ncbi:MULTISPECIES: hypothetical protein [unclassified Corynebacterium]|uniref:hypothetical protein n=1 Tax=unclassified Corynebacterium TaxID=2624378 RepID=UPI0029CA7845|nr:MULTISPECIES: hypothetical protein [unclassified Corynebacterium]WPF66758.1 hypothetical protein OLX12_03260 [Corynebacterium sp. 22KM0430]WPF69246.1 hypothetical protein OLW90_03255 [Corynebacterium sp. 21KM1197]
MDDTIYSLHTGKALGTIAGLGSDLPFPLDVVQIALNPDVQVTGHVGRGDSAATTTRNSAPPIITAPGSSRRPRPGALS